MGRKESDTTEWTELNWTCISSFIGGKKQIGEKYKQNPMGIQQQISMKEKSPDNAGEKEVIETENELDP